MAAETYEVRCTKFRSDRPYTIDLYPQRFLNNKEKAEQIYRDYMGRVKDEGYTRVRAKQIKRHNILYPANGQRPYVMVEMVSKTHYDGGGSTTGEPKRAYYKKIK